MELNHPVYKSVTFKTIIVRFSKTLSHSMDSLDRVNHPAYGSGYSARACDSSATFDTNSIQFSKNLVTQLTVQIE